MAERKENRLEDEGHHEDRTIIRVDHRGALEGITKRRSVAAGESHRNLLGAGDADDRIITRDIRSREESIIKAIGTDDHDGDNRIDQIIQRNIQE